MKRITLILAFGCLSLFLGAQTISKSFTISNSDVQLLTLDGYTHVTLENGILLNTLDDIGKPELPILYYKFIIPADKELSNVQISGVVNQTISSSCVVFPIQDPYPDSLGGNFIEPDTNVYNCPQSFPSSNIVSEGYGQFREYRIVNVGIMPFEYSPATNSLDLISQFQITVTYQTDSDAYIYERQRKYHEADQRAYDQVYSMIENKNDLASFYSQSVGKLQSLTDNSDISFFGFKPTEWPSSAGSQVEMVIVTDNYDVEGNYAGDLISGFETYADWKTKSGIPTIVKSISDIKKNYEGWDTQEQIRNFLIDAHMKWNTEYVILGGDVSIIPAREHGKKGYFIYSYTDIYYADLQDGTTSNNWNNQPDYIFLGINDEEKFNYQDISFGRIPVETTTELDIYFKKASIFQGFDQGGTYTLPDYSYMKNLCIYSGKIENYISDNLTVFEGFRNDPTVFDPTYDKYYLEYDRKDNLSPSDIYDIYGNPPCTNYSNNNGSHSVDDVLKSTILNEFNTGYGIQIHRDHSGPESLGISTLSVANQSITPDDILALDCQNKFGIMLSGGCSTSRFDRDDCIGESWLLSPNGGGPFFIGGILDLQATDHTISNLVYGIHYSENDRIGDFAKEEVNNHGVYGSKKYAQIGDPTLDIKTKPLNTISLSGPSSISLGNQSIQLQVSGLGANNEALICLYKDNELYQHSYVENNQTKTFAIHTATTGNITVTVTSPECLPVVSTISVVSQPSEPEFAVTGFSPEYLLEGELQTFTFDLKNTGGVTANGIKADLIPRSWCIQYLTSLPNTIQIGDIQAGMTVNDIAISFNMDFPVPDMQEMLFTLTLTDQNSNIVFEYPISLPVHSVMPQIEEIMISNSNTDNIITNGNSNQLSFLVHNDGSKTLSNYEVSISTVSGSPVMNIADAQTNLPILTGKSSVNTLNDITFTVNDNAFINNELSSIPLEIKFTNTLYPSRQISYTVDLIRPETIDGIHFYNRDDMVGLWWHHINGTYEPEYSYNIYEEKSGVSEKLNSLPVHYAHYQHKKLGGKEDHSYFIKPLSHYGIEGTSISIQTVTAMSEKTNLPVNLKELGLGYRTWGSPKLFDLNSNGRMDMIFTVVDGSGSKLLIMDETGNFTGSVSMDSKSIATPAIDDIDDDGYYEIIVPSNTKLHIFECRSNGSDHSLIEQSSTDISAYSSGDIRGASIAHGSFGKRINITTHTPKNYNDTGIYYSFLSFNENGVLDKSMSTTSEYISEGNIPAIGCLDNSGEFSSAVFVRATPDLYASNYLDYQTFCNVSTGTYGDLFVTTHRLEIMALPTIIANLDKDNNSESELVFQVHRFGSTNYTGIQTKTKTGTNFGNWDYLNTQYQYDWEMGADNVCGAFPFLSVANIENNGQLQIMAQELEKNSINNFILPVYKSWNADGTTASASNITTLYNSPYDVSIRSYLVDSPRFTTKEILFADVDSDDDLEIIQTVSRDSRVSILKQSGIFAYNKDGSMVEGYPLTFPTPIDATPAIGDIDGDGKNEIVVLAGKFVYAFDTEGDANKIEWGSYRHDNYNTGNYDFVEPCYVDNTPITISTNTTWNNSKRIYSDIYIESGATLTVKGNLGMSEDIGIYVKRGGELKIDGGSIRAACDGEWKGIEVWGNSDADQNDIAQNGFLEQGSITLINASIEDAHKGVLLGRSLPVQYPDELSDFNGGIISANNTIFKNNVYSVMFKPYSYVSHSSINDCQFEFNENAVYGVLLKNFISLYDYEYMIVRGCSFENKNGLNEQDMEEYSGIYSIDSHISVDGLCIGNYTSNGCTEIQDSYFAGLFYGIYASNITSARSIDVRHSNFNVNVTGIYLGQVDYAEIVLNEFTVPDYLSNTNKSGLYIDMSTGYTVQQNDFLSDAWVAKQHGIVVNESGVNENLIYNNTFSKLKQAIKTQGINQGVFEKEEIGLEIRCNEFIACEQDIRVMIPDNPLLPVDAYGIKPVQGNNGPSITDPAGNRFSKFSTLQFKDIENDGIWIRYWHHPTTNPQSNIIPNESYRLTNSYNILGSYFPINDPSLACPLKYDPDELNSQGGSSSEGDLKTAYDSGSTEALTLKTTLSLEVDGGDTPEMIYDVESSMPTQSMELRDELLAETPYLSDTVIKSAIEKEDVLNNTMIYDIMNSNPKSGRSEEILSELDARQNPMPQYMKNVIIANSQNTTTRDSLEAMLAHENQKRQDALARLLAKYKAEIDNPASKDSIIEILHNYRVNEQFLEVLFKYHNGDQTYQSAYNNIPVSFDLTSVEEQRYDILGDYLNLIESTDHENIYFEYDSLTYNQFMEFADNNTFEMKLRSQIALRHFDKTKYSEPYEYEGTLKTTSTNTSDESLDIFKDNIEFYPNPAGEFIIIDYFSKTEATNISVKVFDMNGKHVLTASIQKAPSSNTIDLRSLEKGSYLFSIYEDGRLYKTEKVTRQ